MERNQDDLYEQMKSQLFELLEGKSKFYQIETILNFDEFINAVNSPRDYAGISTIQQLITVLEKRNAIQPNDVSMLVQIIALLLMRNLPAQAWMQKARRLVDDYKSKIKAVKCPTCDISYGKEHRVCPREATTNLRRPDLPPAQHLVVQTDPVQNPSQVNYNQLWQRVAPYCDWKFLRQLPGLTENDMNSIRERYRDNSLESRRRCFFYWTTVGGESVQTETVMRALLDAGHMETVTALF